MNTILEVNNLSKQFRVRADKKEKTIQALDNVSFRLHEGERLGILGSSGCGKTTLLRLILGLITPTSGTIIKKSRAGFVSQDPYTSLCHAMSVEQIIAEPLIYSKKVRRVSQCENEVREAMALADLDYDVFAKRYPFQLSGGERQRVSIVRALINHPGFLALDEPTTMVDYEVKSGIVDVIMSVSQKTNSALLLVTHDITLAKELCESIIVIHDGRIIEHSKTGELLENPKHEQTKKLILAGTDLKRYWQVVRPEQTV